MQAIKLIEPDIKYKDSFVKALRAGLAETQASEKTISLVENNLNLYLDRVNDLRILAVLPDGKRVKRVPQESFWLVDQTKFLGRVSIRLKLNKHLMKRGGNIGYGITKNERRKGYGNLILKMVLPIVKKSGLDKVLITCSDDNIGSIKIIENNGGVLENKVKVSGIDELQRRYWIEV